MKLGKLPRYARLFTADAVAMYTNIELDTALDNITKWLQLFKHKLPKSFPNHKLFLTVLKIVMSNSVFKFGDKYFIQEQGTAMGTPCAGDYANIHVGYRERTELLPTFEDIIELLKRFIDDKGGVWSDPLLPPNLTNKEEIEFFAHSPKWQKFVAALPGGGLEWTTLSPRREIIFLDLRISIKDGEIKVKTFQKEMNLHFYLSPSSEHSPDCLKGIITGSCIRFWGQNTIQDDYSNIVGEFYGQMRQRGWSHAKLIPEFESAAKRIEAREKFSSADLALQKRTREKESRDALFVHWDFHSQGISRKALRVLIDKSNILKLSGFKKLIIALHRPTNLRDMLMSNTFVDEVPAPNSTNQNDTANIGPIQQKYRYFHPR